MRENSLEKIYMVIPWDPQFKGSPLFSIKINFSIIRQKKDHLQPLQTILHRIGPFVSILARSSARTHTPSQNCYGLNKIADGLNTQFYGEFLKNLFLLKKEGGSPLNWASQGICNRGQIRKN